MRIAIASGKGGTGKTFVATNLFETCRLSGRSTLLTDCDAEVPNALNFIHLEKQCQEMVSEYRPKFDLQKCTFCGKCMDYCAFNAIFCLPSQSKIQLLPHLCHGCGACAIACEEQAIIDNKEDIGIISFYTGNGQSFFIEGRMNKGEISAVPIIKQALRKSDKIAADYQIIDAPPGTSCPFIQTVVKADYIILVTEPTPFGLSDLQQAVNTLKVLEKPFGVIINRAGLGDKEMYGYLKNEQLKLLAEIPFDRNIAKMYSEGKLAVVHDIKMQQLFKNLLKRIIEYGNSSC